MGDCTRCGEWFHPECIGLGILSDVELAAQEILCFECKKIWEEDYGDILEWIPKKQAATNTFKYQLTQKLQTILQQNNQKPNFSVSKRRQKIKQVQKRVKTPRKPKKVESNPISLQKEALPVKEVEILQEKKEISKTEEDSSLKHNTRLN